MANKSNKIAPPSPAKTRKARVARKPPISGVKKSPRNSHTSPSKIARAERIASALDFRVQGFSYPKIAKEMNEPVMTVYQLVVDGLKEIIKEPAETLREIELERVDVLLSAVMADASQGDDTKINTALRVMERRSKLLGLDKPQQLDLTGDLTVTRGELTDTQRARALAAFIAKVKATKE